VISSEELSRAIRASLSALALNTGQTLHFTYHLPGSRTFNSSSVAERARGDVSALFSWLAGTSAPPPSSSSTTTLTLALRVAKLLCRSLGRSTDMSLAELLVERGYGVLRDDTRVVFTMPATDSPLQLSGDLVAVPVVDTPTPLPPTPVMPSEPPSNPPNSPVTEQGTALVTGENTAEKKEDEEEDECDEGVEADSTSDSEDDDVASKEEEERRKLRDEMDSGVKAPLAPSEVPASTPPSTDSSNGSANQPSEETSPEKRDGEGKEGEEAKKDPPPKDVKMTLEVMNDCEYSFASDSRCRVVVNKEDYDVAWCGK